MPAAPQDRVPNYVFNHKDSPQLYLNEVYLLFSPGNVPRFTNVNGAAATPTVYITFDIAAATPEDADPDASPLVVHKVEGDAASRTELIALHGVGEHSGTALSDVYGARFSNFSWKTMCVRGWYLSRTCWCQLGCEINGCEICKHCRQGVNHSMHGIQ